MKIPTSIFHLYRIGDQDAGRYALAGVHFETDAMGQPYAVATDGRFLIVATWPDDRTNECESICTVVPSDVCENVVAQAKHPDVVLTTGQDRLAVTLRAARNEDSFQIDTVELEGRFPAWRDIVTPDREGASVSYVDAERLRDLLDTMILVHGSSCYVTLKQRGCSSGEFLTLSVQREDGMKLFAMLHQMKSPTEDETPLDQDWVPESFKTS